MELISAIGVGVPAIVLFVPGQGFGDRVKQRAVIELELPTNALGVLQNLRRM